MDSLHCPHSLDPPPSSNDNWMLGGQFSTSSLTDFILENPIIILDIEIKAILSNLNFTHLKQKTLQS